MTTKTTHKQELTNSKKLLLEVDQTTTMTTHQTKTMIQTKMVTLIKIKTLQLIIQTVAQTIKTSHQAGPI
jgi:hypothetical protein